MKVLRVNERLIFKFKGWWVENLCPVENDEKDNFYDFMNISPFL